MSKLIENIFKSRNDKPILISYVMAYYPDIKTTFKIIDELVNNGTKILEIGIPFSDPIADGKSIQKAALKALENDANLNKVLDIVQKVKKKYPDLAIILMGYVNPIHAMGVDKFLVAAKKVGVNGLIIVDLPYEERKQYDQLFKKNNISFINLLSPNLSEERIKTITKDADGFLYYISVNSTTGTKKPNIADIEAKIKKIRKLSPLNIAVGFGITNSKQFKKIGEFADGIVIGSKYMEFIEKGNDPGEVSRAIGKFNKTLLN